MAQEIGVSHVTLLPHLKELEKDGILKVKQVGRNKEFMLNYDNIFVKDLMVIVEKNYLVKNLNKKFLDFYELLSRKNLSSCIILVNEKNVSKIICVGHESDKIKDLLNNTQLKLKVENVKFLELGRLNDRILLNNSDSYVNHMWRSYCENR